MAYFRRPAVIIFCLTFLIYSPLLFNHYVGDDNIVMGRNTFYHSWHNIPRVFGRGAIADIAAIHFKEGTAIDFGTGKDQYRPVSNVTYFIDGQLFNARPWGSHLVNILIHSINAVLVGLLILEIFPGAFPAVFAALLFSLHPLQSEAVAVMSYRADILAAMFVLVSFYAWVRFRKSGYVRQRLYFCSLFMYGLAVFSKEAASFLPLAIIAFDQIIGTPRPAFRQRAVFYGGFTMVFFLFVYLYFVVFPTPLAASVNFHWLGGSLINHVSLMGYIWQQYLVNLLMPWTVKVIPGHYCPPLTVLTGTALVWVGITAVSLMVALGVLWRRHREGAFFVVWYILFYLPISNLFPVANPMASRYMYMPSIGLIVAAAVFLNQACGSGFFRRYAGRLSHVLFVGVIMICVVPTLFLNVDWKTNFHVACAWVRDYPADGQGYALLGREYLRAGDYDKAREHLEKSVVFGSFIPGDLLSLAECYVHQGQPAAAAHLLQQIIAHYPGYDKAKDLLRKAKFR